MKKVSWTDDCPMLEREFISFIKSNKKFLFVYEDKHGEYFSNQYKYSPRKDIFIKSKKKNYLKAAIFERNFDIKVNNNSIKASLILIDEVEF